MTRQMYISYLLDHQYQHILWQHFVKTTGENIEYEIFEQKLFQYIDYLVQNALGMGHLVDRNTIFSNIFYEIKDICDVEFEIISVFNVHPENGRTVLITML